MTNFYIKSKDCDCKFDNTGHMKNTTLYIAEGFIMLYGCPHTTIEEVKS